MSVTELSERHGVSRKTTYKWIGRYEAEGPDGLVDRSRRPHHCPQATRPEVLAEAFRLVRRLIAEGAFVASDMPYLDGLSLSRKPFIERRRRLGTVMPTSDHCVLGPGLVGEGLTLARAVAER